MDKAHSDLGSLVHKLRDDRVKLADFASFNVAKVFMRDKHPEVPFSVFFLNVNNAGHVFQLDF
jgi:hypothetical protein